MKKLIIFCMSLMIAISGTAEEWELVTDASVLQAGDQVVLACSSKGKVAGTTIKSGSSSSSTRYMTAVDATFNGTELTAYSANTAIFTLSGDASAWTLTSQEGKVLGATAAKNLAWDNGTTTWTISIGNNNKAVVANTNSDFGSVQYNGQNNSNRFCNYTSTQTSIQLYRLANSAPSVTIAFDGFPYARTRCELPTFKAGSTYTLPTFVPEKDGHKLTAWQFAGEEYEPGAEFTVPETDVLFVPVWEGGQGIEVTGDGLRVTGEWKKVVRDGQMIIIRDGIMYNVLGEQL